MEKFIDRLFKSGLVTTILGLLICASAVVFYYIDKPMEEVVILFGWGLTFLRSKDSLIGIEAKK